MKLTNPRDRDWVTAKEFCKRIGMSHVTLSKWIHEGRLPGTEKDAIGFWRIPTSFLSTCTKPLRGRPRKELI